MDPELTRELGDRPVPSDRRQRHLRLKRRVVLRPRPLHVLLLRYPRFLGAGLHLSQLSHFRGPPHSTPAALSYPTPRWPPSTSNAPSSTASGTTPSHQTLIRQITRLFRDEP